jgi:hypothetical protein
LRRRPASEFHCCLIFSLYKGEGGDLLAEQLHGESEKEAALADEQTQAQKKITPFPT